MFPSAAFVLAALVGSSAMPIPEQVGNTAIIARVPADFTADIGLAPAGSEPLVLTAREATMLTAAIAKAPGGRHGRSVEPAVPDRPQRRARLVRGRAGQPRQDDPDPAHTPVHFDPGRGRETGGDGRRGARREVRRRRQVPSGPGEVRSRRAVRGCRGVYAAGPTPARNCSCWRSSRGSPPAKPALTGSPPAGSSPARARWTSRSRHSRTPGWPGPRRTRGRTSGRTGSAPAGHRTRGR